MDTIRLQKELSDLASQLGITQDELADGFICLTEAIASSKDAGFFSHVEGEIAAQRAKLQAKQRMGARRTHGSVEFPV